MAINYEPIEWNSTKYVNPSNMNQMDDGIKAACDGVDALNIEMDAQNGEINALKGDVDALNEGTDVSGKLFISYKYNEETGFVNAGPSVAFMNVVQMLEHLEDSIIILVAGHNAAINKSSDFTEHISDTSNPHSVTKSQVGLGNVPNVSTNNQTPTYTQASTLANLTSGEKLSVSMGKIMKAIADLISHIGNTDNPHGVTKAQVGLGNVDNTADSAKSVKYATSAGKATKDGSGNTIASFYAPKASLEATNTVVSALQESLADAGDNISANANSISDLNGKVTKNTNNITSLKANMIDGRLSFKWTGSALAAYVDNTFVGNVSLSK